MSDTNLCIRVMKQRDDLKAEVERLRRVVDALSEIQMYYESEMDRMQYNDDDLPDELLEAERKLQIAKDAMTATPTEQESDE